MTTEEKAKAYDEAMNKIKPLYEQAKRDGNPIWSTYEYLIPELRESESEDERIRKHLIEIVEIYWGKTNEPGKAADLAWLEKQKEQEEQKPKLYWHKIKAYEKLPCKAYIYKQAFEQENNFFGKATIPGFMAPNIPCGIGCDTWYLPVDDIKNLPKEGEDEQKPYEEHDCPKGNPLQEQLNADARKAEDQLIGFIHDLISKLSWRKDWTISKEECLRRLNDYCPQKPAEWNEVELEFRGEKVKVRRPFFRDDKGRGYSTTEQDEDVAWYALRAWCEKKGVSLYDLYPRTEWSDEDKHYLNSVINLVHATTVGGSCIGDRIVNWIKSLPGRFNLQPKQEWSEAEEETLNGVIDSLRRYKFQAPNEVVDKQILWLKSLRPSWKPSEEQMKALLNAEGYLREGDQFDSAKSIAQLYEQLKKL